MLCRCRPGSRPPGVQGRVRCVAGRARIRARPPLSGSRCGTLTARRLRSSLMDARCPGRAGSWATMRCQMSGSRAQEVRVSPRRWDQSPPPADAPPSVRRAHDGPPPGPPSSCAAGPGRLLTPPSATTAGTADGWPGTEGNLFPRAVVSHQLNPAQMRLTPLDRPLRAVQRHPPPGEGSSTAAVFTAPPPPAGTTIDRS